MFDFQIRHFYVSTFLQLIIEMFNFRLALDLYKNLPLDVSLQFTNPYHKTTMIGYNSRTKVRI